MSPPIKNTKRLFTTGVPVHGKDLAGREKEKGSIKQLLIHGQSVILHGPRRIGKTSLALTVLDELQEEGFFVGHIDIFAISTLRLLAQRITETTLENKRLSRLVRSIRDGVYQAFSKIEVKQTINDFEWILKFADRNIDDDDLLNDALDFPEKFAGKHKIAMIMFFDEIGDVGKFNGESLIKLMRSKFQLHSNVTYLFAGSHASVIQNIFVDHSGPFYRFGQLSPVPRTLAQLVNKGIITKRGKGKYGFADPLFAQFATKKLE
jgi:AAA+ ATPase superfamily predicted ATPase